MDYEKCLNFIGIPTDFAEMRGHRHFRVSYIIGSELKRGKIQLVEMIDLYRNALARNDLTKIANLAIVPVAETNQVASELLKSSTTSPSPSYNFNKVYLVGSSKG